MRIHILGAGVVGRATGRGFERFGHEVLYSDKGDDHNAVRSDITFICTPEGVVPEVVRGLRGQGKGPVAIRSSVPPGTTMRLEQETGGRLALCHNPEFLREATAEADFLETPTAIVGYTSPDSCGTRDVLEGLYDAMGKTVLVCDATESELLKLLNNAHLASLISWWNEAAALCRALGVNSHHLARLMVENDGRISSYGALRHGAPYGGMCLPKDMEQVLHVAESLGVVMPVLTAVRQVNLQKGLRQE